ncbi:hypothetical protein [Proteus faecis]|uniref:hypothetical protein n=1 Tax=Proteus faecis TaxID=2050967 RepID=UPI00301BB376
MEFEKLSAEDVPSVICIYKVQYKNETLKFFNKIERLLYEENKRIQIDLSKVEKTTAMASVLFFAIINRAQITLNDSKIVQFIWPQKSKNFTGHQNIIATGLSKALLAGSFKDLDYLTRDRRLFQSSIIPDLQLMETRQLLLDMMQTNPLSEEQIYLLSAAIGEAMINVKHHAYELDAKSSKEFLGGSRWWQCSWYDVNKDALHFIICDLGCGISRSYKNCNQLDKIDNENEVVKEALSEGFSRFINQGRGNGSEDIKRPIEHSCIKSDFLLIYTGNVKYTYYKEENEPEICCTNVKEFMPGTIVEWCMVPERSKI